MSIGGSTPTSGDTGGTIIIGGSSETISNEGVSSAGPSTGVKGSGATTPPSSITPPFPEYEGRTTTGSTSSNVTSGDGLKTSLIISEREEIGFICSFIISVGVGSGFNTSLII